jgi:hypothetical protein
MHTKKSSSWLMSISSGVLYNLLKT